MTMAHSWLSQKSLTGDLSKGHGSGRLRLRKDALRAQALRDEAKHKGSDEFRHADARVDHRPGVLRFIEPFRQDQNKATVAKRSMDSLCDCHVVKCIDQMPSQSPAAKAHNIASVATVIGAQRRLLTGVLSKECYHFSGEIGCGPINGNLRLVRHAKIYRHDLINLGEWGW